MSDKFFKDRQIGDQLEQVIAQDLFNRNIPFGFNEFTHTDNPAREDFDIYLGNPTDNPTLLEIKMDVMSALTSNLFVEEKTLNNTRSHKIVYGHLMLDVFDTERLREMYNAKSNGIHTFRHIAGGDQPDNRGMVLDWKTCRANSVPYWQFRNSLLK